jgi:hypothetical protein
VIIYEEFIGNYFTLMNGGICQLSMTKIANFLLSHLIPSSAVGYSRT